MQNAPEHSSEAKENERISWYMGSLQPEAEGSPTPEVAAAISFERAVTRRPTHPLARPISLKAGFRSRKT